MPNSYFGASMELTGQTTSLMQRKTLSVLAVLQASSGGREMKMSNFVFMGLLKGYQ
jgi:hypothetical protein